MKVVSLSLLLVLTMMRLMMARMNCHLSTVSHVVLLDAWKEAACFA